MSRILVLGYSVLVDGDGVVAFVAVSAGALGLSSACAREGGCGVERGRLLPSVWADLRAAGDRADSGHRDDVWGRQPERVGEHDRGALGVDPSERRVEG